MSEQANITRPEQQTEKPQAGESASLTHGAELSRPGSNADYNAMKAKGGSTAQDYLPNNFTIGDATDQDRKGSADQTKPGDNAGSAKPGDNAGSAKPGDNAGSAKPGDNAGSAKPGDNAGSAKPGDNTGSAKPGDNAGSAKPGDNAGSAKPGDNAGRAKPGDKIAGARPMDSVGNDGDQTPKPEDAPYQPNGHVPNEVSDKPPSGVNSNDCPTATTWERFGNTWVGVNSDKSPVAFYSPSDQTLLAYNADGQHPPGQPGWNIHDQKGGKYVQVDPNSIQMNFNQVSGMVLEYKHTGMMQNFINGQYILGNNDSALTGELDPDTVKKDLDIALGVVTDVVPLFKKGG